MLTCGKWVSHKWRTVPSSFVLFVSLENKISFLLFYCNNLQKSVDMFSMDTLKFCGQQTQNLLSLVGPVLYILTSIWVLCTLKAGKNMIF